MKSYRAVYELCCTCGAKHGQIVESFSAETDADAASKVRKYVDDHNPSKNQNGVFYTLKHWERIDQEEEISLLHLSDFPRPEE